MSEPRREELTPLFAEFGHACQQAQLLEDSLRLLLLVGREYAENFHVSDEALRDPVNTEGIRSLGALFQTVLRVEQFGKGQQREIWRAVGVRNSLVHAYWTHERADRVMTPQGRLAMIAELEEIWRILREATGIVDEIIDTYLAAYGTSMKSFRDRAGFMWVSDNTLPIDEDLVQ